MKLHNLAVPVAVISSALAFPHLANYPRYRSLAGLSQDEVRYVSRQYGGFPGPQPLPAPINYTGPKLVNDKDHPYKDLRDGDIRGPCPGLNTLASHGVSDLNYHEGIVCEHGIFRSISTVTVWSLLPRSSLLSKKVH